MAVDMKKPWSYPSGYFLTTKMSSDVSAQIVLNGITLLTEAGMDSMLHHLMVVQKILHVQKS